MVGFGSSVDSLVNGQEGMRLAGQTVSFGALYPF